MERPLIGDEVSLICPYVLLWVLNSNNMPTAQYEIKRKCKCCGAIFLAKSLDSYYCSRACSNKGYKQRNALKLQRERWDKVIGEIPDKRDYISVTEAEAVFGVCAKTIRRLINSGKVSSINLGQRLTRVRKSELMGILPLREEPVDARQTLPKPYNLEPEDCYTIGEIAEKFAIAESTVYSHIRKYSIPIRQIGRFVYAPKSEIDRIYKDVVKK
ncbi:helix-turn-helix domain-containing protein [Duncaniella muris]|uniref:helix-turn-helix domain-containing protein n=4 Tax=Bacteroidia TaxID=200643 RepID=UPI00269A02B6